MKRNPKKKNKTKYFLGILCAGILIFLSTQTSNAFILFGLLLFTTLVLLITILLGIYDIFNKSKFYRYPGALSISLIFAWIALLVSENYKEKKQYAIAEELVVRIEEYETITGDYPSKLELTGVNTEGFSYYYVRDQSEHNYRLGYNLDGANSREYTGTSQTWSISH